MAIIHLDLKRWNAGKLGAPLTAHAQYLLRQVPMTEHVKHALRERPQERQKEDLVASGAVHLPFWALGNAMTFWEAAQTYSRKGGVLCKELEISLPREYTQEQNLALIHRWLDTLPRNPTIWAFHMPKTRNQEHDQPHVHILVSNRPDDGTVRTPAQYFQQPNHGGVVAQRLWTQKAEVRQLWKDWERVLRQDLRAHGLEQTLERPRREKEIALTWNEMQDLKRLVQRECPNDWGHESRIPVPTIQQWQTAGKISVRQATFLTQRGERQRQWALSKDQAKVWEATRQVERTSKWQPVARRRAVNAQAVARKRVQVLERRTAQSASLSRDTLHPALQQDKAQYHREKALEREAHRRLRSRGRGKGREVSGAAGGLQADLGNALDEQRSRRTREHAREHETWDR